jgi:hypothetical protein
MLAEYQPKPQLESGFNQSSPELLKNQQGLMRTVVNIFTKFFPESVISFSNELKSAINKFDYFDGEDFSPQEVDNFVQECWNNLLETFAQIEPLDSTNFLRFKNIMEQTYPELKESSYLSINLDTQSTSGGEAFEVNSLDQILNALGFDIDNEPELSETDTRINTESINKYDPDQILKNLGYNPDGTLLPNLQIKESIKESINITRTDTTISEELSLKLLNLYTELLTMFNLLDQDSATMDKIIEVKEILDSANDQVEIKAARIKIDTLNEVLQNKLALAEAVKIEKEAEKVEKEKVQAQKAEAQKEKALKIKFTKDLGLKGKEIVNSLSKSLLDSQIPPGIQTWIKSYETKLEYPLDIESFDNNYDKLSDLVNKITKYNQLLKYFKNTSFSQAAVKSLDNFHYELLGQIDQSMSLEQFDTGIKVLAKVYQAIKNDKLVEIYRIKTTLSLPENRRAFSLEFIKKVEQTSLDKTKEIKPEEPNLIKDLRNIALAQLEKLDTFRNTLLNTEAKKQEYSNFQKRPKYTISEYKLPIRNLGLSELDKNNLLQLEKTLLESSNYVQYDVNLQNFNNYIETIVKLNKEFKAFAKDSDQVIQELLTSLNGLAFEQADIDVIANAEKNLRLSKNYSDYRNNYSYFSQDVEYIVNKINFGREYAGFVSNPYKTIDYYRNCLNDLETSPDLKQKVLKLLENLLNSNSFQKYISNLEILDSTFSYPKNLKEYGQKFANFIYDREKHLNTRLNSVGNASIPKNIYPKYLDLGSNLYRSNTFVEFETNNFKFNKVVDNLIKYDEIKTLFSTNEHLDIDDSLQKIFNAIENSQDETEFRLKVNDLETLYKKYRDSGKIARVSRPNINFEDGIFVENPMDLINTYQPLLEGLKIPKQISLLLRKSGEQYLRSGSYNEFEANRQALCTFADSAIDYDQLQTKLKIFIQNNNSHPITESYTEIKTKIDKATTVLEFVTLVISLNAEFKSFSSDIRNTNWGNDPINAKFDIEPSQNHIIQAPNNEGLPVSSEVSQTVVSSEIEPFARTDSSLDTFIQTSEISNLAISPKVIENTTPILGGSNSSQDSIIQFPIELNLPPSPVSEEIPIENETEPNPSAVIQVSEISNLPVSPTPMTPEAQPNPKSPKGNKTPSTEGKSLKLLLKGLQARAESIRLFNQSKETTSPSSIAEKTEALKPISPKEDLMQKILLALKSDKHSSNLDKLTDIYSQLIATDSEEIIKAIKVRFENYKLQDSRYKEDIRIMNDFKQNLIKVINDILKTYNNTELRTICLELQLTESKNHIIKLFVQFLKLYVKEKPTTEFHIISNAKLEALQYLFPSSEELANNSKLSLDYSEEYSSAVFRLFINIASSNSLNEIASLTIELKKLEINTRQAKIFEDSARFREEKRLQSLKYVAR